jgi:hypothetical protein
MTAQNRTHGPGTATTAAGVGRRALIQVAWTTPVVAAAVAAPGAAASTPSPVADERVVLGLLVGSYNPREVAVNLSVTRFRTSGPGNPPLLSDVDQPTGAFPVSAKVTRGPIDTGSAALLGSFGQSSVTSTVRV